MGVRVIVGDVQGKGLEAVETAAAVVGAFREAAYDEADLADVVTRLESTLDRMLSGEKFVTAVLAEYNDDQITLLSCGHPPPLVLTSDGGVCFAEPPEPAPPLGMRGLAEARPVPCRIRFAPGDQMLFYTDGVIEARDQAGCFYPLEDRSSLLKAAAAEQALEDLRADLLRHVGGTITDDAVMSLYLRGRSRWLSREPGLVTASSAAASARSSTTAATR
ncbi:MAG TPA: PP2C family protein-serine/threonine phosphatase [Actinoallomurus sp.]|nr:PP2C family protein-serine/threonine phosphatase [Actinoallomurus sp.]